MSHLEIKTSFQRTVEPSIEPITLTEAREHLRNDDQTFDDSLIDTYIAAARVFCEDYTNQGFITQTWRQNPSDFGDRIILSANPVLSVTTIKYFDTAEVQQTLPVANFQLDNLSDTATIFEGLVDGFPNISLNKVNPIEVLYQVGYGPLTTDVPQGVIQAIKIMVGYLYQNREMINVPIASIATQVPIPLAVKQLLSPYRVRMFG